MILDTICILNRSKKFHANLHICCHSHLNIVYGTTNKIVPGVRFTFTTTKEMKIARLSIKHLNAHSAIEFVAHKLPRYQGSKSPRSLPSSLQAPTKMLRRGNSDLLDRPKQEMSCFRRIFCSSMLAFGCVVLALLLAVTWYIVVPFLVDNHALHSKYTFTPRSTATFTGWGTSMLVIMPWAVIGTVFSLSTDNAHALRALICASYAILLIVGNILGSIETTARNGYENEFAVKFNHFYCDTRTLRVCLEGNRDNLAVLTRGNATAILASENPTDIAFAVWDRCQYVLLEAMDQEAKMDDDGGEDAKTEGEKEIETKPLYNFLDNTSGSRDIDAWCGNVYHYKLTPTIAQQQALPSPYASNPEMFAKYTREWSRRMLYSNVFLGTAAGLMLLAAICKE